MLQKPDTTTAYDDVLSDYFGLDSEQQMDERETIFNEDDDVVFGYTPREQPYVPIIEPYIIEPEYYEQPTTGGNIAGMLAGHEDEYDLTDEQMEQMDEALQSLNKIKVDQTDFQKIYDEIVQNNYPTGDVDPNYNNGGVVGAVLNKNGEIIEYKNKNPYPTGDVSDPTYHKVINNNSTSTRNYLMYGIGAVVAILILIKILK